MATKKGVVIGIGFGVLVLGLGLGSIGALAVTHAFPVVGKSKSVAKSGDGSLTSAVKQQADDRADLERQVNDARDKANRAESASREAQTKLDQYRADVGRSERERQAKLDAILADLRSGIAELGSLDGSLDGDIAVVRECRQLVEKLEQLDGPGN